MNRFYDILAIVSAVTMPVAMSAALGWTVYAENLVSTGVAWIALMTGLATAVSLEAFGIAAGETTLRAAGQRNGLWLLAAAMLLVYVVACFYILWDTPLVPLPILAGATYVLAGVRAQVQRDETVTVTRSTESEQEARAKRATESEWQREQWRIEQDNSLRIELARLEAAETGRIAAKERRHELKLSQLAAERTTSAAESNRKPNETVTLSTKAREIQTALAADPYATRVAIAKQFSVSPQYVSQVARMNGHR